MVWLKAPKSHNDECQRTEQIANGYGKKYDQYSYRHLYYDNQQLHLTLFTRFFKYYPPDSVPATRTRTLVPIRAAPRPHLTSAVSCQVGHLLKGIQEGCYSDNRRPGRHKTGSRNTEKRRFYSLILSWWLFNFLLEKNYVKLIWFVLCVFNIMSSLSWSGATKLPVFLNSDQAQHFELK